MRDLKAQVLYRDFSAYEQKRGISHQLTYNAFAEAARAGSIMTWLGWSNSSMKVENTNAKSAFFRFLITKVKSADALSEDEESIGREESAEAIVRKLRDMLKMKDADIQEALIDGDIEQAELFYEDRREGTFTKRLRTFLRSLKNVKFGDLTHDSEENVKLLNDLVSQARDLVDVLKQRRSKARK